MSKKDDLLNNNNDETAKPKKVRQTKPKKIADDLNSVKGTNQDSNANENYELNQDEIISVELYNEILSTLFNTLNNPIVRNEIKANENILKYLELQISNLFYLETALSKELTGKKMAKEFLQLTANILNLALTVNKSHKKTRIEILEDRNLLIVTIVNSCKGVERETLERVRTIDSEALKNLNNQILALSSFTSETNNQLEDNSFERERNSEDNLNDQQEQPNQNNNLNEQNIRNLNANMNNMAQLGMLPQHPATNPKFYPYLSKPTVVPILKRILSGMLIFSSLLIIVTIVISLFVKGNLTIVEGSDKEVPFSLSQTNNWIILIMTIVLYAAFAYMFVKPTKLQREKYHMSYFMLGLLFFWLIVSIAYFFWEISDNYYTNYFLQTLKEGEKLNPDVIQNMKALANFQAFKICAIITAVSCMLPLIVVLLLILINPRLDRNKVMKANMEYQNAINAALSGKKYDIDPSLFDDSDEPSKGKRKKANFSGRF